MPITKSATGALKKDKKRTKVNKRTRKEYRLAIKEMRKNPSQENLKKAYSKLDKAAKRKVIHKKKSSRLKSRLTKFLNQGKPAKNTAKPAKKPKKLKK